LGTAVDKTYVYCLDVRGLANDFQFQPIRDNEDNNHFIIVNFNIETNATELPKTIAYTLRVRHNGLETHSQYLKAVQDSYFEPNNYDRTNFPYRQSGFLAVQLVIDNEICRMLLQDRETTVDVSVH
jgi:hypothetical protein